MKHAALTVKILSRRAGHRHSDSSLIRFLAQKSERKFVSAFVKKPKDLQYYLSLWRGMNMLDTANRKAMTRVIGTEIDLKNIVWLYRLKRFYGIFGDKTYGFLIPIRHRLSGDVLAKMAACKDVRSLQAAVSDTIYDNVFGDFVQPEQQLANAVKKLYKVEGRRSHIALLCGYLEGHK